MNKNLLIKSGAALIVISSLSYTAFWFFKASQIKEQVTTLVTSNGSNASLGEVKVSGFPLTYKATVKDIKFSSLNEANKGSLIVKNIDIQGGVFSSDFVVKTSEPINIEYLDGVSNSDDMSIVIDFNADAKISFSSLDNKTSQFNYKSSGHKISFLDKEKKVAFISESKNPETLFIISDNSQYKHSEAESKILDKDNNVIFSAASSFIDAVWSIDKDKKITSQISANIKDFTYSESLNLSKSFKDKIPFNGEANIANLDVAVAKDANSDIQPTVASEANIAAEKNISEDKNNFAISVKFTLTPNNGEVVNLLPAEQMEKMPPELRAQFQKKPAPYLVSVNLESFEFFNPLYKISVNGAISTFSDDDLPSGSLSIKIDNYLIKLLSDSMTKATPNPLQMANQDPFSAPTGIAKIISAIQKLASANPLTKDDSLVFDIKRDKGAPDALVNNISFLQFMAETMMPDPQVINPTEGLSAMPQPEIKSDVKKLKRR